MSDPEGLEGLAALITSPRVITPSLTGGRHLRPDVEIPDLVAEPVAAKRRKAPTAPPAARPRGGAAKGEGQSDPRPYVAMGPLTLRADQAAWVRQLRIEALQAGADFAVTDLVRVALDRLRDQDGRWPDLQADLAAETKARTRRRGI
ncbi:MAG: hypothetical protein M0027_08470 [Candidatus Dormibacteraeota bacterium]|nr:hypothetical protein [Candidatus Dormibacteraeota bacterium]